MRTKEQVLDLILEGLSIKEIADKACITEGGVKYHIGNLLKEYNCQNRTKLIIKLKEQKPKSLDLSIENNQIDCPIVKSYLGGNDGIS